MGTFRSALLALAAASAAAREPVWTVARAAHFEVYSNAGDETTRALAAGFERLHDFFAAQLGAAPHRGAVRVICFASEQEFAQYRAHTGVGAFYIGAPGADYIVMPAGARGDLRIPAHEYAHLLVHSTGWTLPPWIAEGISEVASTVKIGDRQSRAGGVLSDRLQALRSGRWMPLAELFVNRVGTDPMFYAQSWAVADLLVFSPRYSARFPAFLASVAAGVSAERALADVYRTTPDAVTIDLRARVAHPDAAVPLPGVSGAAAGMRLEPLDGFDARSLLAGLRFAAGDLERAEALYRTLAGERPRDAATQGALGTIAFQRGDTASAAAWWKRAIDLGIADAGLCYRYAVLSDDRAALERAIELDPGFDDARYKLALQEKNAGRAEAAVAHFRAMREVGAARAFAYWISLGDALLDLNRRAEARQAFARASDEAGSEAERKRAEELDWIASTELAVEFDGRQARTVRVPVDGPPRNPFFERGERMRSAEGVFEEVECGDDGVRVKVRASEALTLSVPDLSRVQIRNGGGVKFELTCGPQTGRRVLVEYTPAGVLRGLELR